jgi:hypothetical protein
MTELEQALARKLTDWQAPEPELKATELVALVRSHGWRPAPSLSRPSTDGRAVPPEQVPDRVAALRAVVHSRPEWTRSEDP